MIKLLFVCHGNICRSPMAAFVMKELVRKAGLEGQVQVASAATSREEIGNSPHYGTANKLRQEGIPLIPHRAFQMTKQDYEKYDYLIGMDSYNIRSMMRITGGDAQGKMYMLLDFAGRRGQSIADPWYSGNFEDTYRDVLEGCEGFLGHLEREGLLKKP